jgi:hypothetical protein
LQRYPQSIKKKLGFVNIQKANKLVDKTADSNRQPSLVLEDEVKAERVSKTQGALESMAVIRCRHYRPVNLASATMVM